MNTEDLRVDFYRHSLQQEDIDEVVRVLHTLFLTTGPVTQRFEQKLAAYLGRQHALGVTSCTTALFLCLKALGVGEGDEVISSPMTFIASVNAILYTGAKPVLVDVEPTTGNIDIDRLEAAITPRTKAVLPVHLYGQMVDMKRLAAICKPRGIAIIEDAAHALEAVRDGIRPGELGDAACFSFYATKNLTCGEGGAICVDDPAIDEKLRKLRLHGMSKSAAERYTKKYQHWDMELLGYKANIPDILSALMVNQIDRLDNQLARREQIAQRYEQAFSNIDGLDFPRVLPNSRSARHLFTIWVPEHFRDQAMAELQERKIGVAINFRAIHLLTYYRETFGFKPQTYPIAEKIGNRTISIPFFPSMSDREVERVIEVVEEVAKLW